MTCTYDFKKALLEQQNYTASIINLTKCVKTPIAKIKALYRNAFKKIITLQSIQKTEDHKNVNSLKIDLYFNIIST